MEKKPQKIIFKTRLIYLFLGFFFAIAFVSAQAAWNTKVNTGDILTVDHWNNVVDKLTLLDNQPFRLSAEQAVTEIPADGDCVQTVNLGNHLACFLTFVRQTDQDDSGNDRNDHFYCRVYKIGASWYLEAWESRNGPWGCFDGGSFPLQVSTCKARCLN